MSNYTGIKALINADIRENNNEEITGQILNGVLLQMVTDLGAYQFAGVATPTTDPGTPDINVYYVAGTPGIYSYMGEFSVVAGEFAFLLYNGSWTKLSLPVRYVDASSDQNIGGNKTFTGNVVVYGNLGLVGGLSLGGDLSVDGDIGATGSITAGGDLIGRELYEYDTDLGDYVLLSQKYMAIANAYTKTQVDTLLAGKQATLVSGVNIKTINNQTLLGSGNITIQGGGTDELFWCEYGGTTWTEIEDALTDGLLPVCIRNSVLYMFAGTDGDDNYLFTSVFNKTLSTIQVDVGDSWTTLASVTLSGMEYTSNKVTSVSSSSTDTQYPSAKCLYDALLTKQGTLTPGNNITISNGTISAENGIFLCTYGSTSVADIITALSAGKLPVCEHTDGRVYILAEAGASAITFTAVSDGVYRLQLTYQGTWSTITPLQKVTSVSSSSTDNEIPTAKCLYDLVGDIESLLLALL